MSVSFSFAWIMRSAEVRSVSRASMADFTAAVMVSRKLNSALLRQDNDRRQTSGVK